jgi:hypothetical protein
LSANSRAAVYYALEFAAFALALGSTLVMGILAMLYTFDMWVA